MPPQGPLRPRGNRVPFAIVSHTTQSGRADPFAEHWPAMRLENRMTEMAARLGLVWLTEPGRVGREARTGIQGKSTR